jgi:hypothetical protein
MPYPWYTKVTREDVLVIKAYLLSLAPVHAPRAPNKLKIFLGLSRIRLIAVSAAVPINVETFHVATDPNGSHYRDQSRLATPR